MGTEHTGSAIRVRKPKLIKDLNLTGGHFSGFGRPLVIETRQVQDPVDCQVRPMGAQEFILRARLERDQRRANHQLAEEVSAIGGQAGAGK